MLALLFEAGLIASRIIFKDREQENDDEDDEDDTDAETAATVSNNQSLTDEELEAELDQAEADEAGLDKK